MATLINRTYVLSDKEESIKFQISLYCFVNKLNFTKNEIDAITLFYTNGVSRSTFDLISKHKIFKHEQSVKNFVSKLGKLDIIKKDDNGKRYMTDKLDVIVDDSILINLKIGNK